MKRSLITIFILLFICQTNFSQVIDPTIDKSSQELYNFYTLKEKKNNTVAWIMIGSGIAILTANYFASFRVDDGNDSPDAVELAGMAVSLGSIHFFNLATTNKKTAKLFIKGESVTFKGFSNKKSKHLSIALAIDF